jgi:protein-ribulosamine 3-kinase
MKLDQAVAEVIRIKASNTTISSAGGGGCSSASTWRIDVTEENGSKKAYFMKSGKEKDSEVMFKGEHASLSAIHAVV